MIVTDIYKKYKVTDMLQLHLLRTTAVAKNLCDNWTGPEIDKKEITEAMLFHDVGNIVKFDLENGLLAEEKKPLEYWQKVQKEFREKYGTNDYLANEKIAKEIGVSQRSFELIEKMGFRNNCNTVASDDYSVKICVYSDLRVGPYGILSLRERIIDANKRYKGNFPKVKGVTNEELVECAFRNEKDLLRYTKLDEAKLNIEIKTLRSYDFNPSGVVE